MSKASDLQIGVVIVTYASSDVIEDCLNSLLSSDYPNINIAVCDNASPDDTLDVVRKLADKAGVDFAEMTRAESRTVSEPAKLTLIRSPENLGFAGGVNTGLDFFMNSEDVDLFWVLNPDSAVQSDTASMYAKAASKADEFALMTGRMCYFDQPQMIQSDGGRVNLWTGMCSNVHQGMMLGDVSMPQAATLDFASGANIVASRAFIERSGKMREDYFLYYEEVDWALRRGDMPLILCPEAIVFHHGGTVIGSGSGVTNRQPSAFSNYFNYRNRMIFIRRFRALALPVAYVYSLLKIIRLVFQGYKSEAYGAWRGLNYLSPPPAVAQRLDEGAQKLAFRTRRQYSDPF